MTLLDERTAVEVQQVRVARRMGIDHAAVHRLERRPLNRVRPATAARYRSALEAEVAERHAEDEFLAESLEATARKLRSKIA